MKISSNYNVKNICRSNGMPEIRKKTSLAIYINVALDVYILTLFIGVLRSNSDASFDYL